MRLIHTFFLIFLIQLCVESSVKAQREYIMPEGKIINNRTLLWGDFLGHAAKSINPNVAAATQPAIYAVVDSVAEHPNNRITIKFRIKCAFQSASWVRESLGDHSDYILNHEQDHYDIALIFANKLQADLCSRDYSMDNYFKEIESIYIPLMQKYDKTEDDYDKESDHSLIKENQALWDMRIKKCMENNTDEFFSSPENIVQTVKYFGQSVKRIHGEPARQFVTRCRPLYSELTEDLCAKIMETKEWSIEKAVIVFYSQKYKEEIEDQPAKDCSRLLAYAFVPVGKDIYKRILIDTFTNQDKPIKIGSVFFANVDSDNTKELVIMTTSDEHSKQAFGTLYTTRVYDNITSKLPGKLKRLDDVSIKVEGGFEGTLNNKPSKAKCKTQKDVEDVLKKLGY